MPNPVHSFEYITLQNDSFFADLTAAVRAMRMNGLTTKAVMESNIEKIIFKRLKMNVNFSVVRNPTSNAWVVLPPVDGNHVFTISRTGSGDGKYWNYIGEFVSGLESKDSRIGYVDMQKVHVGGVYSTIPISLSVCHGHFHEIFTDAEIAATILHELGHAWTYFLYLMHTSVGSFTSLYTSAKASGASSDKEKIAIIERGCRVMGIDGVPVKELAHQNQEQLNNTLQTLYINATQARYRTETGFWLYEMRTCEQIADWFSSKISSEAPLAMATGLAKSWKHENRIAYETYRSGGYAGKLAALTVGSLNMLCKSTTNVIMNVMLYDDNMRIYDKPSERVRMLRNSVIDSLKDMKLSTAEAKPLIESANSLAVVEKQCLEFDKTPTGFIKFIRERLIANYRYNRSVVELQKDIESLMYNDAYLHAARLRGIGK